MSRRVLILGATSAIAEATARLLVQDGDRLFLVGRDADRLDAIADDLGVRGGARVERLAADLDDTDRHAEILVRAADALGGLDTALIAHGVLGDPEACAREFAAAAAVFRTNLLGPVSLLTHLARRLSEQGGGTIVVISSVAGDRGRQSNYVYGSSKGALSLFLQGLRNRLHARGVRVITVKPGLVDTPMTAHLPRGPLFASPATIAAGIRRALRGRRDVVYLPWFWRPIMLVVRSIPEFLFKRLGL
jgi:NAD(P)-dependent dehydrogenase (short-subunit alcohol dehydrogenase family)